MSSIDTKELIKKPMEEAANKSSALVAKMVTELQAQGLIITEETVRTIIAPRVNEVFVTAYTFGVDIGSQFTIKQINDSIEKRLSNCEKSIVDLFKQLVNTAANEKHS